MLTGGENEKEYVSNNVGSIAKVNQTGTDIFFEREEMDIPTGKRVKKQYVLPNAKYDELKKKVVAAVKANPSIQTNLKEWMKLA